MSVVAIDVLLGQVFFDDGSIAPITDWLDGDGYDCERDAARAVVAGPVIDPKRGGGVTGSPSTSAVSNGW